MLKTYQQLFLIVSFTIVITTIFYALSKEVLVRPIKLEAYYGVENISVLIF